MVLQTIWFVLVVGVVVAFAVLSGFDLGVGVLYPFLGRSAKDRDALREISGPYWDANQVWLVLAAGALFAAFPPAYAAVFSAFYLPLIGALLALALRAVSFAFAGGEGERRRLWDWGLFLGSTIAPFLLGMVAGGVVLGLDLDARGDVVRGGSAVVSAYSLLAGALTVALFAMHGAAWAALKADSALRERCVRARQWAVAVVAALTAVAAAATSAELPGRFHSVLTRWPGVLSVIVLVGGLVMIASSASARDDRRAFLASSASVASLIVLAATAVFPALVPSHDPIGRSLTLENSSASQLSLTIMLGIAVIGLPIVLAYTALAYWLFSRPPGSGAAGEPPASDRPY